ncbi:Meckelin [Kappamyces sp. JEL0680]|nr:Meckelin [Kappamyces sp. JEL0680]
MARQPSRVSAFSSFPFNDQPHGLPWLYWGAGVVATSVSPSTIVSTLLPITSISVSPIAPAITYVLGIYTVNGTFLGFEKLSTQFVSAMLGWNQAGKIFSTSCSITIQSSSGFEQDTLFYEICKWHHAVTVVVQLTSGSLYPVAVRINPSDPHPTVGSLSNGPFYRRFMLVDRLSGIKNGALSYIQVPTSIQFWLRNDKSNPGQVYIPVLDITYTTVTTDSLPAAYTVEFGSSYITDYSSAYNTLEIVAAVFGSFVFIYAFFMTRFWNQRNMLIPEAFDMGFLLRLFLNLSGYLPMVLFWYIFALALYMMLFYKTQGILFVIIPIYPADLSTFSTVLGICTLLEFINITKKIMDQCQVDIFFIDWEQAKIQQGDGLYEQPKSLPVSVWRSIFMSNEWAKLQGYRFCSTEFCLLGVVIILEGFAWKNVGTAKPNLSDLSDGVMNPILMFAIDTVCWLFLIVGQKLFHYLFFGRFYRNKVSQYIDVLSLSNVSLLLLDEKCHGYYIHGKSVHTTSDTSLEELNSCLQKEASDMVPRRGLLDTNQQAFEFFPTHEFRNVFDKIYKPSDAETARTMAMMNKLTLNDGTAPRFQEYKSPVGNTANLAKTYKVMTKYLQAFFEQNLKDYPYSIKKKTFSEQLFGASADTSKGSVLMHDNKSITSCLMVGVENDLLILYMSAFGFMHIATNSVLHAALTIWILDLVLTFLRVHFGERNIAQKSLIDPKFLI